MIHQIFILADIGIIFFGKDSYPDNCQIVIIRGSGKEIFFLGALNRLYDIVGSRSGIGCRYTFLLQPFIDKA